MIATVTMKTPDALQDAIERAVESEMSSEPSQELDDEFESRVDEAKKIASKWFKYDEYVTLEIDFEKQTCVVL